jgi:hypothetical protein
VPSRDFGHDWKKVVVSDETGMKDEHVYPDNAFAPRRLAQKWKWRTHLISPIIMPERVLAR